ncbi:MAG: hypothetical protein B7Z59_11715 [Acidiphilium sp. 37-67-22]|nr:MAG: hypothetical protein B7Z59_11715 [Acidiphilium sp. 37-67-22]
MEHDMVNDRRMVDHPVRGDMTNDRVMRLDRAALDDVADHGMMCVRVMCFHRAAFSDMTHNDMMRFSRTMHGDMANNRVHDLAMRRGDMHDGVVDRRDMGNHHMRLCDMSGNVVDFFDRLCGLRTGVMDGDVTGDDFADGRLGGPYYRDINNTSRLGMSDLRAKHDGRNATDDA